MIRYWLMVRLLMDLADAEKGTESVPVDLKYDACYNFPASSFSTSMPPCLTMCPSSMTIAWVYHSRKRI